MPAPIVAALADYQFATLILRKAGYGLKGIYSLGVHYAKNLRAYYSALTVGSHNYYEGGVEGDLTPFVNFFCAG